MTATTTSAPHASRQTWLAVLARATQQELEDLTPQLGTLPSYEWVRPPEVGMVMLQGRVGGTGDPFNLGEASVVRCALRIGNGPLGIAYALGRNKRKAEMAALCDALLQDPVQHEVVLRAVVHPLANTQSQLKAQRTEAAAQSKVEFFTFVRGEA